MQIEGSLVAVNLDQEKKGRIANLLMDIEPMAPRLGVAGDARVAQQPITKRLDDVLANPEMCGVKNCHGVVADPSAGRQAWLRARRGIVAGHAAHDHAHDIVL